LLDDAPLLCVVVQDGELELLLLNGLWLWMDELLSADELERWPLDVVLYKLLVLMLLQMDETELQLDEKEWLPSDELALL
jgi:hypothetical protein